ncbi:MAG TPA: hypothetical protein VN873_17605 [Candidatus Angelobacter sp.]|nr:hypothetical protein [Candidatus Angelobacter sp.]
MNRITVIFHCLTATVLCILLAGCAIGTPRDLVRGKGYQPQNVFVATNGLPSDLRRVAMLPTSCDESDSVLVDGRNELQPILMEQLIKTKKFEVVSANSDALKTRLTRADWSSEEPLPPDLLALLQQQSGCDAVMFSRLTVFRAYPPLEVGWRMRLVDVRTGHTLWAADEIFNGGEISVDNGARRHQLTEERVPSGAPDEWFIRNSPDKFGEYTAARLLATLPPRQPQ